MPYCERMSEEREREDEAAESSVRENCVRESASDLQRKAGRMRAQKELTKDDQHDDK